jgi:hypothetical protein
MKTISFIVLLLLTASTSFSCVFDKDVEYEQFSKDLDQTVYIVKGSIAGTDIIFIKTKIVANTRSKKSSCKAQEYVIDCKKDIYRIQNASSYRNNIKIGYIEVGREEEIEDNTLPAKLADTYCKEK